jgi:hypothetical protein
MSDLLLRNIGFDGTRTLITASFSGGPEIVWTEGAGRRFYVDKIGSTFSNLIDAVEYNTYLTFSTYNTTLKEFFITQLNFGETLYIQLTVMSLRDDGSAGYGTRWRAFFRRGASGAAVAIGAPYDDERHDGGMNCTVTARTQTDGVWIQFLGVNNYTIDWNVHITYYKGYHTLTNPAWIPSPIDPRPPDA